MLNSTTASNNLMAIGLIVIYGFGYIIKNIRFELIDTYNKKILFGGGLIIYSILTVLFLKLNFWIRPPFWSLIIFYTPFILRFNKSIITHVIAFAVILVYSFYLYPYFVHLDRSNQESLKIDWRNTETNIELLDKNKINFRDSFPDQVVLIETWNEYCGNCFQAMKDLHPFLVELEKEFPKFRHYYIYTFNKIKDTSIFYTCKFLPYENMPTLIDVDQRFSKKYLPPGLPQFRILDNSGNVVFSLEGYQPRYKEYYKRKLKEQILAAYN